ncbi:hypothetical protein GCM10010327_28250 [Streptomyces nitrosporeus]|nr:hypothetical protein GCM10010327_28250 [Streptomyces nitrosporeus]
MTARMVDEGDLWRRLAGLLPPADTESVLECREIGEQEAGIHLLVSRLFDQCVPIGETARAELAMLAEVWGVREELAPDLTRIASGPEGEPSPLELIETADMEPLRGASVGGGKALDGLLVVPWIACPSRIRVLARAHRLEWWGGLSWLTAYYVLFTPGDPAHTRVFETDAAWEALGELRYGPSGGEEAVLEGDDE